MLTVTIHHFITLSCIIFIIGFGGAFLNKRHLIVMLLCVELMLLAVNINMVAFSYFLKDFSGQIFSIFILTLSAAEAAIGLAIIVLHFKHYNSISINMKEDT